MKNKQDFLYITVLIIFCILLFFIFGKNIYSPYSDIGRELYVAEQVKNGEVLYKDIFNVYFPLGYWLNAVFIKLFGSNLNTFYGIGLTFSILTIIPFYLINKIYTNNHLAFFITLFIITSCTFYPSISNWITPYSYSILYALCSVIWAFYFLLKYIDTKNNKYLYLGSFFTGLSICFKYEYIAFVLILLGFSIYKKNVIKPILILGLIPLTVIAILFIQGCTIEDLFQSFNYMCGIASSNSAKYFYQFAGITLSIESFISNIFKLLHPDYKSIFGLICFVNTIIFVITLIKKQFKLSLLLLTSILTSIKSLGGISLEIYGTYFFPLLFMGLITTIYGKENKIKTIIVSIICLMLSISYFKYGLSEQIKYTKINTHKGEIVIPKVFKNSTIDIIDYISKNTKESEKVLILAEGTLINYITNRKSDNFLYYLIPPNTEIFGNDFIIKKIQEKKIDYIITTNIQYPWYNEKSFMTGWGNKYLNLIQEEYKQIDIIGDNLKFYIFKHDII